MSEELNPQRTAVNSLKFIIRNLDTGRLYKTRRLWVTLAEEPTHFATLEEALAFARQLPLPNLEILLLACDQPVMGHRVSMLPRERRASERTPRLTVIPQPGRGRSRPRAENPGKTGTSSSPPLIH